MQASSGYPLCRAYPTIGAFLGTKLDLKPDKVIHLYSMIVQRLKDTAPADPFRVFMKAEPHKPKKVEEGRWRLIFCCSLVDQVIDQLLFGEQNDCFVQNHRNLPIKPGWTPYGGGLNLLRSFHNPVSTDKSSWDWLYPPWLVTVLFKVRLGLWINPEDWWQRLATYRYQQTFVDARVLLSSGKVFRQLVPGLMKSGLVNTISDNSISQLCLHILACKRVGIMRSPRSVSMGDDELKEWFEGFDQYFVELSKMSKIKEVAYKAEFAGITVDGEPCHVMRNLASLVHTKEQDLEDTLDSYQRVYAMSGRFYVIKHLVTCLAPRVRKPQLALKHWFLYGE